MSDVCAFCGTWDGDHFDGCQRENPKAHPSTVVDPSAVCDYCGRRKHTYAELRDCMTRSRIVSVAALTVKHGGR